MHISHTKSFNRPVSIALATLADMINVYEICLNTDKISNIQYARFHILPVDLHFGLFWSACIPTMLCIDVDKSSYIMPVYSQCHVDSLACIEQNVNNQTLRQV